MAAVLGWLFQEFSIDKAWVDQQISHSGYYGMFIFVLTCSFTTAVGLPRQVAAFLGGYAFGIYLGTLLATLAATIGCSLTFYFARLFVQDQVRRRFTEKVAYLDNFLAVRPFSKTLVFRLLPIGSNLITNLVAGVSQVKARYFIFASGLGFIPTNDYFCVNW